MHEEDSVRLECVEHVVDDSCAIRSPHDVNEVTTVLGGRAFMFAVHQYVVVDKHIVAGVIYRTSVSISYKNRKVSLGIYDAVSHL